MWDLTRATSKLKLFNVECEDCLRRFATWGATVALASTLWDLANNHLPQGSMGLAPRGRTISLVLLAGQTGALGGAFYRVMVCGYCGLLDSGADLQTHFDGVNF